MVTNIQAFVDEYGDTSVDVESSGVTSFFIITAVLLSGDYAPTRAAAEEIRRKHFQTGEMKSSSVGANDERRVTILHEISTLDIRNFILAVDKRKLNAESGLVYRRSFFKFTHRLLYDVLCRVYQKVSIVADEHGGEGFMRSFESYVDRQFPPNLFVERSFRFADSRDEVLLQIADFTSGSIARTLDPKKLTPKASKILELVMRRSFGLETWPPRTLPVPELYPDEVGLHDELIRRHCIRQVELFLDTNEDAAESDEQIQAQVEVPKFLLFNVRFVDPKVFLPTAAIIDHLGRLGVQMTEHAIRSSVIGPLRDSGVVLASGSDGYKIPICEGDIAQFLAHANSIIPPMLSRISRARHDLMMASDAQLDILKGERFSQLRSLVASSVGRTEVGESS